MVIKYIFIIFFLMIRRPPRSTLDRSSAASDVYKRQVVHPRFDLANDLARIAFIAREPVRASERYEILVTVELPDQLVVADQGRVEIIDSTPVNRRGALRSERLEVPIDGPIMKILVAEKIESTLANGVSRRDDALDFVGPASPELPDRRLAILETGEKPIRRAVSYTHLRAHETGRNLVC